jgi:tetratricopeptide (TPR) repeat protein
LVSGRFAAVVELADAEIARAVDAGADAAVGLMLIWRGAARANMGDDDDGIADLRDAVRILDEQAHPKAANAAYNLGDILQGLGRLDEASAALEHAMAIARRSGEAHDTAECTRALLAFHRGERAAALAMIDRVSIDTNEWIACLVSQVRGRLLLDDAPQKSAAAARRHLAYARRTSNVEAEFNALSLIARAELAMGNTTEASAFLDEYLETWHRVGGVMTCSASLGEAGRVLVVSARHAELVAAVDLIRGTSPWTDAARALGERRHTDAAAKLDSIPSIPLRDAALALSTDI